MRRAASATEAWIACSSTAADPASVAADLHAWFPKLKPQSEGGRLGGHDYSPEKHPELCQVVKAFAREHGLIVRRGPRSVFDLAPR